MNRKTLFALLAAACLLAGPVHATVRVLACEP